MCLFIGLLLAGPRLVIILWYLAEPARWALAFDTAVVPILGFLVLPWTTVMYVLVSPLGVTGFDWLWLGLALLADFGSMTGGAWKGRQQMSGSMTPP